MRQILIILLIFLAFISHIQIHAQQNQDTIFITKKEFIGTWQRNSKIVGNGMGQNFEFFDNGRFILNLGSDADDIRNTIQLKGTYRLEKDKLYFTITSKTVVDGNIGIADMGVSFSIFELVDAKVKEIQLPNPKELADPCYITIIEDQHIKINNEVYYKVK